MKTHYCGRIEHRRGICLFGWPVCCWGDKAERVRARGNQSPRIEDVDCKACLRMYDKRTNR